MPAHLKAGDFEYSYKGPNDTAKKKAAKEAAEAKETESKTETEIEDEFMNEPEENEDDDDDFNSEEDEDDDPNKLWCICQQPHNNRFMICCDSCSDWFHGKCVGITKKMGKEMEEAGKDWTCPSCQEKSNKEKDAQLKDKLKERENSNKKSLTRTSSKETIEVKKVMKTFFDEIQTEKHLENLILAKKNLFWLKIRGKFCPNVCNFFCLPETFTSAQLNCFDY